VHTQAVLIASAHKTYSIHFESDTAAATSTNSRHKQLFSGTAENMSVKQTRTGTCTNQEALHI